MHDFTAEFLKCVKFHGKFTERVSEIHGPHAQTLFRGAVLMLTLYCCFLLFFCLIFVYQCLFGEIKIINANEEI